MKSVNLIPASRLVARRRRAHVQRCVFGCVAYAALAAGAALACGAIWGRADATLPARLADAQAAIDRASHDAAAAKSDLDAVISTLRAARSIAAQPDWSTLMRLLSTREGDDIVLRECKLAPRDPASMRWDAGDPRAGKARDSERVREARAGARKPAPKPVPVDSTIVVSLAGLGRSQPAVSQFVLRLEALHLFSSVALLDTHREGFLNGEAAAFRIDCMLETAPPSGGTGQ